jgi:hypothetical protein
MENLKRKYEKETNETPYCWNQKGEYIKNGSYSDGYVNWLESKLKNNGDLSDVSDRRELLCAFFKFFRDNGEANIGMTIEQFVDAFLAHYNR